MLGCKLGAGGADLAALLYLKVAVDAHTQQSGSHCWLLFEGGLRT